MFGQGRDSFHEAQKVHPEEYATTSSAINEEGEEWNPRLHLVTHAATLDQMEELDEVKETYETLTEEFGLHSHAAIHALSYVLSELIFDMMSQDEEYDRDSHLQELEELTNPNSDLYQMVVQPREDGDPPAHPKT